jgi:hypothetical protein
MSMSQADYGQDVCGYGLLLGIVHVKTAGLKSQFIVGKKGGIKRCPYSFLQAMIRSRILCSFHHQLIRLQSRILYERPPYNFLQAMTHFGILCSFHHHQLIDPLSSRALPGFDSLQNSMPLASLANPSVHHPLKVKGQRLNVKRRRTADDSRALEAVKSAVGLLEALSGAREQ